MRPLHLAPEDTRRHPWPLVAVQVYKPRSASSYYKEQDLFVGARLTLAGRWVGGPPALVDLPGGGDLAAACTGSTARRWGWEMHPGACLHMQCASSMTSSRG